MKTTSRFWRWLTGGYSFGKLRVWPWKAEFWRLRTPQKRADMEL